MSSRSSVAQRSLARVVAASVARPANAYLLTGGGDVTRLAARDLAAALVGARGGDVDRIERAVHPDVVEFEPAGASGYLAEQADRDIRSQAHRAPLEARRKVLVVNRADLLGPLLESALLKTIEEPPGRTTFILCATDPAAVSDAIVSRCLAVAVPPLPLDAVGQEVAGVDPADSAEAARLVAATGSLDCARALLADPEEAQRRRRWLSVPARVQEVGAAALARELAADFEAASASLGRRQAEEVVELEAHVGGTGVRGAKTAQRLLDERHRREQRAAQTALLRRFVSTLAGWFRDVLAVSVGVPVLNAEVEADVRAAAHLGVSGALRALDRLARLEDALEYNAAVGLQLEAILVDLRRVLASR